MSLLTPDFGLLFWMLLSFSIVVFILVKYGFPVILGMVEKRNKYIDDSLLIAMQAHEEMASLKVEGEAIIQNARKEQMRIMNDAASASKLLVESAKLKAQEETSRMIKDAQKQIIIEKENAISEIRNQVADLSVAIAERVLREQLSDKNKQIGMINRLIDEINISKS